MAYYNEFFVEVEGELIHIGSSDGSDTPSYFDKVKSIKDWMNQLVEVGENNNFWSHHNSKHPFPWKSYSTSDHLLVLHKTNKKWFEFWKPAYQVLISVKEVDTDDENKVYFIEINKYFDSANYDETEFKEKDLILFDLPKLDRGF